MFVGVLGCYAGVCMLRGGWGGCVCSLGLVVFGVFA